MNLSKSNGARNRSAKRIPLQVPLTVTGRDQHGTAFSDQVRTENVSIDGGCLLRTLSHARRLDLCLDFALAATLVAFSWVVLLWLGF